MDIGAFSLSLAVKDIKVSHEFYQKLGFSDSGGNLDENWVIMRNGNCVIGLFQGMFDKNILTFIPGWDQKGQELKQFTDIRKLQEELKSRGIKLSTETDTSTSGPANFTLEDPDGNAILFDQYR
jgi:predicted lactoylglutathione lyase